MLPEIGALIGGKYKIERLVGEGGMAVVYEATTAENARVAIKVLKPDLAKSEEVVTRFRRETRAVRKLRSPHAVEVSDYGVTAQGLPYMVMEFLVGHDLSQELEKNGPLPIVQAVGYVIQACIAIREAHHRRIVHRDLKPDNLFLVRAGEDTVVKVLDFGVSKIQDELGDTTKTQSVMGTPYYMSPEQVRSTKSADARSDLWSIGVILYEILTGKVPYDGNGNMGYVMVQICTEPLPSMREARPEISPELERAILRALEKDRDKRIQTAEELIRELSRACGLPMPPLAELEPIGSQPEISTILQLPKPPPPKKPPWVLIGVAIGAPVLFCVVFLIGGVFYRHEHVEAAPVASVTTTQASASVAPAISLAPAVVDPPIAVSSAPAASSAPHKPVPSAKGAPNILSHRR